MPNKDLFAEFSVAYQQLQEREQLIGIICRPIDAWAILSAIQLASRHPGFTGPVCELAIGAAIDIQSAFFGEGTLGEVAERGWNSEFDK